MEVNLSPEIEEKLNELAAQTGRPAAALAEDAITGYVDAFANTRAMLDRRYDEIEGGKVKLIAGEEVEAYFRNKSAAARRGPAGS